MVSLLYCFPPTLSLLPPGSGVPAPAVAARFASSDPAVDMVAGGRAIAGWLLVVRTALCHVCEFDMLWGVRAGSAQSIDSVAVVHRLLPGPGLWSESPSQSLSPQRPLLKQERQARSIESDSATHSAISDRNRRVQSKPKHASTQGAP